MTDAVQIDRTVLQIVFDVAVNSMDFGSGCLVDEDVEALRAVAVLLEVDPMLATPDNFKCKYAGEHKLWGSELPKYANMCRLCRTVVG
jgi:hypothetical protein